MSISDNTFTCSALAGRILLIETEDALVQRNRIDAGDAVAIACQGPLPIHADVEVNVITTHRGDGIVLGGPPPDGALVFDNSLTSTSGEGAGIALDASAGARAGGHRIADNRIVGFHEAMRLDAASHPEAALGANGPAAAGAPTPAH